MPELLEKKAAYDAPEIEVRRVLFVCTGNTCRSPMAAAWLNDRTDCVCAVSAGLAANEGEPITPHAAAALFESGVIPRPGNDYTAHRAHTVTEADVEMADEVIAISTGHAMQLLLRFPAHASKIFTLGEDVPDPFGGSADDYRTCLTTLSRLIAERFSL